MIRTIKIELNAAFPQMPLQPFQVFHDSAAAVTILNVPRRILSVSIKAKNVSAVERVFPAQRSGSAWIVTIPGEFFAQTGTSTRGVKIDGADEAGNIYTLGAADLVVLKDDGTVTPVQPLPDLNGKRDKTDLDVYEDVMILELPPDALPLSVDPGSETSFDFSSVSFKQEKVGGYPFAAYAKDANGVNFALFTKASETAEITYSNGHPDVRFGGRNGQSGSWPVLTVSGSSIEPTGDKLATRSATSANALAKFDANGNLVAASPSDIPHDDTKLDANDPVLTATAPSVDASATSLAGAKATGEALAKKADEFDAWVPDSSAPQSLVGQPKFDAENALWEWYTSGGSRCITNPGGSRIDDVEQQFIGAGSSFTATRKRVLYTGDAYEKPSGGIPATDMTQDVQTALANIPTLASPSESATDAQAAKAKSTYDFVNSSINAMAAFYITKNAAGDSFATKAELTAAIASGTFYNGGQPRTPTKNDYLYILADESHPTAAGTSPTTRYSFDGTQWSFQIVVNDTALTAAQLAAMNSGINAALVTWLTTFKGTDTATTLASIDEAIAEKADHADIFGNDGKPSDTFATNLLGKQVANAKVRYALATTASATMADRTVNIYTLSSGTVPMVFPTATTHDGKTYARDFLLKLTYSGGTLQMPTGVTKVGDELSFEAGKTYLIAFTEISADKFYVRSIDITEAQA